MLQPSFARVTGCWWRDHPSEGVSNPDKLGMAVQTGPTVATMSTSCSDGSDLHGYRDHFSGESDPQWLQTGDLSPGAYNTGHHRPGVRSNQIGNQ